MTSPLGVSLEDRRVDMAKKGKPEEAPKEKPEEAPEDNPEEAPEETPEEAPENPGKRWGLR